MTGVSSSKQQALKHERLLELLSYDPETGVFTNQIDRGYRAKAGAVAGGRSHKRGYRLIKLDYESYLAQRLAWFYVYGEWPVNEVDHIDGDTSNNKLANLRVVTHQQNSWNKPVRARKGGILRNIRFKDKRPQVMFARGSARIYHKSFPTLCAAIKERNRLARELYGEFTRASN